MSKTRFFLYGLIAIPLICLVAYLNYEPCIAVEQVNALDNLRLPLALQKRLDNHDNSELLLVRFDGRKIQFVYSGFAFDRVQAITRLFKRLAFRPQYRLQKGDYLFNLHDGNYEDYGWPVIGFAAVQKLVTQKTTVLIPAPEILDYAYKDFFADIDSKIQQYPWNKKIDKIFWRGSLTGSGQANNDLLGSERLRFLHAAYALDFVDAGVTSYTNQHNPQFAQKLAELYPLKKSVSPGDAQAYKYLMDVDGNSCSYSRMAWILYSNSVLFKHDSDNVQWYYDQLQPFVHYVPIKRDFSDLAEKFRWAQQHQMEMENIATNSRKLATKIFKPQNVLRATADALHRYREIVK